MAGGATKATMNALAVFSLYARLNARIRQTIFAKVTMDITTEDTDKIAIADEMKALIAQIKKSEILRIASFAGCEVEVDLIFSGLVPGKSFSGAEHLGH